MKRRILLVLFVGVAIGLSACSNQPEIAETSARGQADTDAPEPAPVDKAPDDTEEQPPEPAPPTTGLPGRTITTEEIERIRDLLGERDVATESVQVTPADPIVIPESSDPDTQQRIQAFEEFRAELVLALGPELGTHVPADDYSWTAVATSFDDLSAAPSAEWSVTGWITPRYLGQVLEFTAADIASLAELDAVSVPQDQPLRRWGDQGTFYVTGLFPEIVPWANTSRLDPEQHYVYDPFDGLPPNLFPSGLDELQLWTSLRAIPEFTERDGWKNHRVTTAIIDPDYWNWRHREDDGIFRWVLAEHPEEQFQVTLGTDEAGRLQRFMLETTDPGGGGLVFDVRIAPKTGTPPELPNHRPADWLTPSPSAQSENESSPAPDLEQFYASSRQEHASFDHDQIPEHLTLIATFVWDEPTGAYSTSEEYYHWPSVYFEDEFVGGIPVAQNGDRADTAWLVCLDREDNEWRIEHSDLELFWHGYADGSSLDDRILRFNANAWMQVDVYPTTGDDRLPGDPCLAASQ